MQDDNTGGVPPITPLAQPYGGDDPNQGAVPVQPMGGYSQNDPMGAAPAQPMQPMDTMQPMQPVQQQDPIQPIQPVQPVSPMGPEVNMSTPSQDPMMPTQDPLAGPTTMMSGGSVPPTPPPLSDAPQSFTQREPSAFDIGADIPRKKKKFPLFTCFCGLFFILFLVFGGLTAVAYFTDTEIPFFSDLAAKIEEMLGGKELTAEQVQQKVADTLIGAMLPFVADNEGLMSAVAKTSISDEYIQNFVSQNGSVESVRFEVDASVSSTGEQESSMEGKLVGAMDAKEKDNEKFETTLDGSISGSGMTLSAKGEMKVIGPDTYIKLDEFPQILPETEKMIGKWIETTAEDVEQVKDETVQQDTDAANQQSITEDDITHLKTFITDPAVIKNVEILPDETIHGNESKCLRLSWNKEELKSVMKRYSEIFGDEYNEQSVDESLDGITLLQMEACLGNETNNIHRIKVHVETSEDTGTSSMTLGAQLWDYNADINIVAPSDSLPFEEVMQDFSTTESMYFTVEDETALIVPDKGIVVE